MVHITLMPYLRHLLLRVQHLLHSPAPPWWLISMKVAPVTPSVIHPQFIPQVPSGSPTRFLGLLVYHHSPQPVTTPKVMVTMLSTVYCITPACI